ncbi:Riboflavin synthase alpha chain [Loxospora ochrophaea]|nr:Riboflavin synthase alpha chain [Loxospora ochrophaea]
MFTGLVEAIGTVTSLEPLDTTGSGGGGTSLTISDCADILADAHLGDSISINGTCLTITSLTDTSFKVGLSPETLRRTNLSSLKPSSRLNLERSLLPSTRMGGHFVQGHVDTIATIESVTEDGNSLRYRLKPRDTYVLKYVVEKGYVTLDGASLTVTAVNDEEGWWEVMLIAYTQEKVVMGGKGAGDEVNVEVDMMSKYVEKNVKWLLESGGAEGSGLESMTGRALEQKVSKIVEERMKTR